MGICFGHQLVNYVLGANIIYNPIDYEIGIKSIIYNDNIKQILQNMINNVSVSSNKYKLPNEMFMVHGMLVGKLPENSDLVNIGSSGITSFYGILGTNILTVQGHPDLKTENSQHIFKKYNVKEEFFDFNYPFGLCILGFYLKN